MRTRSSALTNVGRRTNNEDSYLADDERVIYAVADGMGGHVGGEVASRMAVDGFLQHVVLVSGLDALRDRPGEVMFAAAKEVHQRILAEMRAKPRLRGMGTTLTAATVIGGILHLAHVGDSACYVLRAGRSRLVTSPQTVAAAIEASGKTVDERWRNVLNNCLGVEADAFSGAKHVVVRLFPGDVIVLCTDGLTCYLPDPGDLAEVMKGGAKLEEVPALLVDHALRCGGQDNVTVVAVAVG